MRKVTLEQARAQHPHRYTMEHVPAWALKPFGNGTTWPAPQFRSDREWYDATAFPGEKGVHWNSKHCVTGTPTWPLGKVLVGGPYRKGMSP